jgi:hypothetical protein
MADEQDVRRSSRTQAILGSGTELERLARLYMNDIDAVPAGAHVYRYRLRTLSACGHHVLHRMNIHTCPAQNPRSTPRGCAWC